MLISNVNNKFKFGRTHANNGEGGTAQFVGADFSSLAPASNTSASPMSGNNVNQQVTQQQQAPANVQTATPATNSPDSDTTDKKGSSPLDIFSKLGNNTQDSKDKDSKNTNKKVQSVFDTTSDAFNTLAEKKVQVSDVFDEKQVEALRSVNEDLPDIITGALQKVAKQSYSQSLQDGLSLTKQGLAEKSGDITNLIQDALAKQETSTKFYSEFGDASNSKAKPILDGMLNMVKKLQPEATSEQNIEAVKALFTEMGSIVAPKQEEDTKKEDTQEMDWATFFK